MYPVMDEQRLIAHKLRNSLQSLLLLGVLAALCAYLAWLLAGTFGLWLALGFVVFGFAVMPAASPRLIMRAYRAEPIQPQNAPRLHAILQVLAERAGLPRVPTLFYQRRAGQCRHRPVRRAAAAHGFA